MCQMKSWLCQMKNWFNADIVVSLQLEKLKMEKNEMKMCSLYSLLFLHAQNIIAKSLQHEAVTTVPIQFMWNTAKIKT